MPNFDNYPGTPPSAAYANGTVTVGTTATLVCTPTGCGNVVIQNGSGAIVFLGGSAVTASGAAAGVQLAIGATITIPVIAGAQCQLYAICASATSSSVTFLYPVA